jgi:pilus assembly protein CpaE
VSIQVTIVGSTTNDLEEACRTSGIRSAAAPVSELLRFAQPGFPTPRVVVLDLRQQTSLPPAVALMKSEHPSTGVVIVAGTLDPVVMLEAMRAGVTEWVAEPVKPADLTAAIHRVAGIAPVAAGGDLFVVLGAKGGVGTTTLAVNLATTLAADAKGGTLLVDVHPSGGDAALFLGAEPRFTLRDALNNTHRLDEAYFKGIVVKTASGPDLLAAPDHGMAATVEPGKLRAVLDAAKRAYRYVVADVEHTDVSIEETLDLASRIVVVVTQELPAVRAGARTAALLKKRYGKERVEIVLNRYDRSSEIPAEELERTFTAPLVHRFPSNYRLAIDALNKGRPIVVDNHNKLAASFTAHARSLSGATARTSAPADRPAGLLSKLTGRR